MATITVLLLSSAGPKKELKSKMSPSGDVDSPQGQEDANQHSEASTDSASMDGQDLLDLPGLGCPGPKMQPFRRHLGPQSESGIAPKTLLGRVASAPSPCSGCNWSPRTKFRNSSLGKAMRVELMWEDDVRSKLLSFKMQCDVLALLIEPTNSRCEALNWRCFLSDSHARKNEICP